MKKIKSRKVDVKITEPNGNIIFEKARVTVPEFWSDRAATILASKYLAHGETSAWDVFERVSKTISNWGLSQGYFKDIEEKNTFKEKLLDIMLNQRAMFNSPVLFNLGVKENSPQCSACFIYDIADNMEDILSFATKAGITYKSGSGTGVNVSKLRAKGELLSNRGNASGPISFMRIWDQVAGSIKSAGKTRRAASMIVLDVDHPDIEEFIICKLHEEKKAKLLIKAGYTREEAYATVSFQNANHSVMITDKFMEAVENDSDWDLINRGDGQVAKTVKAKELFRKIAEVAWETGDPGLLFYENLNTMNPIPHQGDIIAPNPCAEFTHIPDSSCNLASINLVRYLNDNNQFDWHNFCSDIHTMITAQDILIDKASYPTEAVKNNSINSRPLGLGFTNLGALLMRLGISYNDEGHLFAAHIARVMTSEAYKQSIGLAKLLGSYKYLKDDLDRACDIADELTGELISKDIREFGLRNSQLTLLAPTGTISFLMDCDSTGIEPLFARTMYKTLSGGGVLEITPDCAQCAIDKYGEDHSCLKTAQEISPEDHILMMAACQKHLHGSISKTINLPANAAVEDVENAYLFAYKNGLKAVALYRDGSKGLQPLTTKQEEKTQAIIEEEIGDVEDFKWSPVRRRLPDQRQSITKKFNVGGLEGYITAGLYDTGEIGEVFIRTEKTGTTIQGLMDGFATTVSLALQYGVPVETLIDKFIGSKFEPAGFTSDENIRMATSVFDYIFKWIKQEFGEQENEDESDAYVSEAESPSIIPKKISFDGPPCSACQTLTMKVGTCYLCPTCGSTSGCS